MIKNFKTEKQRLERGASVRDVLDEASFLEFDEIVIVGRTRDCTIETLASADQVKDLIAYLEIAKMSIFEDMHEYE